MKKKFAFKAVAGAIAAVVTVGGLAACSGGGSTPTNAPTNAPTSGSAATEKPADNNAPAAGGGIDTSDGLAWDTAAREYVLEDDVASGKATLVAWVDNDGLGDYLVTQYKFAHPGVNIEFRNVGSVDSEQKMALEGEAGTGGDIFIMAHDHFGAAMNSAILGEMGKYEAVIKERVPESAYGTVENGGKLWGVPLTIESIALYYNKTLLEKLVADGILTSAEPATDFSQIFDLAAKYNDPAKGKWTLRWQADDSYYDFAFLTPYGYDLFGPDNDDPDKINFNTDACVNGLTFLRSLRTVFDVAAGDANWDYTTVAFKAGETPYLISGPWSMEQINEGAVENGFEYGITTLPKVEGKTTFTFSGVQVVCVSSYSKYPAAARNLAMFVTGDVIQGYEYGTMGKVPALNTQYGEKIVGLKDDAKVQGIMAQAANSVPMPSIPEVAHFWSTSKTMFISVYDGLSAPKDAAQKAEDEYNTLRTIGN